jgi:hypothetical protein
MTRPLSCLFALVLGVAACARAPEPPVDAPTVIAAEAPAPRQASAPRSAVTASATVEPAQVEPRRPQAVDARAVYPWLGDPGVPVAVDALVARFAPPPGFTRVALAEGSFGAWLRGLPLAAPGTPVTSHRGAVILPPGHANLAAVVAIDVGAQDLQQCADSIIRLHAEWLYAQGKRDMGYRAASGTPMPFARWAQGERMVPRGIAFEWVAQGKADAGRASFRRYLDAVFAWANTGSLARDTDRVALDELRPGDFVVQPGAPGHAVLVLDVATGPGGRRALLLGQGFMPAQSFQVLKPGADEGAWFLVDPGSVALDTPFWAPFPWKTLHRFPGT